MKKIFTTWKMLVFMLIFGLSTKHVNAQQTVYSGLRLPQLTTEQRTIVGVEAHPENGKGKMIFNADSNAVQYWNGIEWIQLDGKKTNPIWFYMPSIVINVSQNVMDTTINLYDEYLKQFDVNDPKSKIIGSGNAPDINNATKVYARNELHYYVIGHDDKVFVIHEITEAGEMKFNINATNVSEETFMNIVFVVK